jgi:hypothetical protein
MSEVVILLKQYACVRHIQRTRFLKGFLSDEIKETLIQKLLISCLFILFK